MWAALLTEFAAELRHLEPDAAAGRRPCRARPSWTTAGVPWVPRLGGRAPLGAGLEHVARTGRWDQTRYAGRSEARMAVLGSRRRPAAGSWPTSGPRSPAAPGTGLAALYERRSEPGRMERLLPLEWRKTIAGISREKNVRMAH